MDELIEMVQYVLVSNLSSKYKVLNPPKSLSLVNNLYYEELEFNSFEIKKKGEILLTNFHDFIISTLTLFIVYFKIFFNFKYYTIDIFIFI